MKPTPTDPEPSSNQPAPALLHVGGNPAIAGGNMLPDPFHQELYYLDGDSQFARRYSVLHLPGSRSQIFVLRPVFAIAGIPDALHQLLFMCEVIGGIGYQTRQKGLQDGLALPLKHGPMHLFRESEQALVLLVDLPNADRIIGSPLERRHHKGIGHLKRSPWIVVRGRAHFSWSEQLDVVSQIAVFEGNSLRLGRRRRRRRTLCHGLVNVALPLHRVLFGEILQLARWSACDTLQPPAPGLLSDSLQFAPGAIHHLGKQGACGKAAADRAGISRKPCAQDRNLVDPAEAGLAR